MLLSRAADQLYWMSRYLERAEHTARLIDVQLNLRLDDTGDSAQETRWGRLFTCLHMPSLATSVSSDYDIVNNMAFDSDNPNSLVNCISNARDNARAVRELISSEQWEHLNRLYLRIKDTSIERVWYAQPHDFFMDVRSSTHLFQGITDSTMLRGQGWHFIEAGRYIERATSIAMLLGVHYNTFHLERKNELTGHYLEWIGLLKSFTAFEAYCKVYTADLRPDCIAEFLLLNPHFPHSVRFSIGKLQDALDHIANQTAHPSAGHVKRLGGRLRAKVEYGQVDEILNEGIQRYLSDLQRQCAQIHDMVYQTFINYPVEREI